MTALQIRDAVAPDAEAARRVHGEAHGLLAAGAANGEFTLWAPTRKNPMVAEVTMPSAATKFAWRPDDSLLAVGTEKGQVFVFKTA